MSKCIYCGAPNRAHNSDCTYVVALEKLQAEHHRYKIALESLRREHYACDDCWYSCPKSESGSCDESKGTDCDCGADRYNAIVDVALQVPDQESFQDVVRNDPGMTPEQKSKWLAAPPPEPPLAGSGE